MPTGSEPKPALLVSACLLGVRCNHRGEASPSDAVAELAARFRLVAVCPETLGGLPTPRPPAEIGPGGSVRTAAGDDVTESYRRGAEAAVALAAGVGATGAVLKARSPSCGCREIYDGTFSRTRVAGRGIAAAALAAAGLTLQDEDDVAGV